MIQPKLCPDLQGRVMTSSLAGMFTVETNVDPDLMVKIAIRERFVAPRVKQAILMVATRQLIDDLAKAWTGKKPAAEVSRTAVALVSA